VKVVLDGGYLQQQELGCWGLKPAAKLGAKNDENPGSES